MGAPYYDKVDIDKMFDIYRKEVFESLDSVNTEINGKVNTTENLSLKEPGVYRAETSGTIGGIVVKEGYYTLLRKKDDGNWSLESEVKVPVQDLTAINSDITALKNKNGGQVTINETRNVDGGQVFNFVNNSSVNKWNLPNFPDGYYKDMLVIVDDAIWESLANNNTEKPSSTSTKWKKVNIATEVDQEFNIESLNAISNKAVTPLANALKSNEKGDETIIKSIDWVQTTKGYINTSGLHVDLNDVYNKHTDFIEVKAGYKITGKSYCTNSSNALSFYSDNNQESFVSGIVGNTSTLTLKQIVFTVPSNGFIRLYSSVNPSDLLPHNPNFVITKIENGYINVNEKIGDLNADSDTLIKSDAFTLFLNNLPNPLPNGFTLNDTIYNASGVLVTETNLKRLTVPYKLNQAQMISLKALAGFNNVIITNKAGVVILQESRTLWHYSNIVDSDYLIHLQFNAATVDANTKVFLSGYNRVVIESEKINSVTDYVNEKFKSVDYQYTDLTSLDLVLLNGFQANPYSQIVGNDIVFKADAAYGFTKIAVDYKDKFLLNYFISIGGGVTAFDKNMKFIKTIQDYGNPTVGTTTEIKDFEFSIEDKNISFIVITHVILNSNKISLKKYNSKSIVKKPLEINQEALETITDKSYLSFGKINFGKLYFVGKLPTDDSDARKPESLTFKMYDDNDKFLFAGNSELSIQGHGSAIVPKKGYTFDLYNSIGDSLSVKFGDMVAVDSFHLRAYYSDRTHSRDVGGCKLWRDMINTLPYPLSKINNKPTELSTTVKKDNQYIADANYFPNGFPVAIYINGLFQGLFTFRHKKTRQNYALDNSNLGHIFLDSATYTARLNETFDYTDWEIKSPKMSGYEDMGPVPNPTVLANINRLFDFTRNLAAQKANHADFIVLKHWIHFLIFSEFSGNWDIDGNNVNLMTWNGTQWTILPYDLDQSFGLRATTISTTQTGFVVNVAFWNTFKTVFATEIKEEYTRLRASFLHTNNLTKYFINQTKSIPRDIYKADFDKWGLFYTNGEPQLEHIFSYIDSRLNYLDTQWKA